MEKKFVAFSYRLSAAIRPSATKFANHVAMGVCCLSYSDSGRLVIAGCGA
jgi:hypothetical protein